MKKSIFKRKRFWLIVIVCLFLWSYSILIFFRFGDENYVGELQEVRENSIIVDDRQVGNIEIYYDAGTQIFPKDNLNILEEGKQVFVATYKNDISEIHARFIRFIQAKHR